MSFLSGTRLFKRCGISFFTAFIITLIPSGLLAVIFSFFHPSSVIFGFLCRLMGFFSSFIAAFLCARGIGRNGLFSGIVWGDLYMAILILLGIVFFKNTISLALFIKILAINSLPCSIAGVMGINFKK